MYYSNYYDQDCEPDHECYKCDENIKKLETSKEFLESLVTMLYSNQELDLLKFEEHLDELCHQIGVKNNNYELKIQRLTTKTSLPIVDQWMTFNNQYLTQLTKTV